MSYFSVIIPTMWQINNYFSHMIKIYEDNPFINEIIIIDNNPESKPDFIDGISKIKLLSKGYNTYINPAWNWGVSESKNDKLIIANDDIIIDSKVFHKSLEMISEKLDEGNITIWNKHNPNELKTENNLEIEETGNKLIYGNGIIFFTNKKYYKPIPNELKLYFGDNFIFNHSDKNYVINMNTRSPMSGTINSNNELKELSLNELKTYMQYFK